MPSRGAHVLGSSDGRAGLLGSMGVRFMLAGGDTGGGFSLVEHPQILLPDGAIDEIGEWDWEAAEAAESSLGELRAILPPEADRALSTAFTRPRSEKSISSARWRAQLCSATESGCGRSSRNG